MTRRPSALPRGIRFYKGKYQVRFVDPQGRRRGKSFERLEDARAFQALAKLGKSTSDLVDGVSTQPFSTWAWEWLDTRLHQQASKKTKNASIIEKHLIGDAHHGFGRQPIGTISQLDVQRWVSWMSVRYSPSYVRTAFAVLSGILQSAYDADLIRKVPLKGIKLPKPQRKSECFLSEAEIALLVECVDPFHRPLIFTAAWTGLRWGELAGLQRHFLDLGAATIRVQEVASLTERGNELTYRIVPYPKNDWSRREIGLPQDVVDELREHLRQAPLGDLVFATREGRLLHPSNFRNRYWRPAVQAFLRRIPPHRGRQLQSLRFHDLRHTHCSLLIAYGWTESQIIARMGWRDGRMLHGVYGHLFRNHDRELVEDLQMRMRQRPVREINPPTSS